MKSSLVILILFLANYFCIAQSDSIKVYDIMVMKNIQKNILLPTDTVNQNSDSLQISIYFKVNFPDSLNEVYIKIGNVMDGNEASFETLTFQNHNQKKCLHIGNNEAASFTNHDTFYTKTLKYSIGRNIKWVTLWIKDVNGNLSSKQFFKIK